MLMDGYTEKVFKRHCLFFNGTSLSTWMFILRFMLRIHRCSFNRKRTHTHSRDKFQPASFLSCFTPNRLFCLSMYMSLPTRALGFYLTYLCARPLNLLTKVMPLQPPQRRTPHNCLYNVYRGSKTSPQELSSSNYSLQRKIQMLWPVCRCLVESCVLWL